MEGPSKAEISCTDNQDGTCSVSYLPVLPGDYSIVVKYNDKHIAGSPFTARITGTGGSGGTPGCFRGARSGAGEELKSAGDSRPFWGCLGRGWGSVWGSRGRVWGLSGGSGVP